MPSQMRATSTPTNGPTSLQSRPFVHHKSASFASYLTRPLTPPEIDYSLTPEFVRDDAENASSILPPALLTKKIWAESKPLPKYKLRFNMSRETQERCIESIGAAGIIRRATKIYQYTRTAPSQVRLLYIKPGRFDEDINASLLVVNDHQLGTHEFPYVALSYHWGSDAFSSTIIIQDDPQSRPIKNLGEVTDLADIVCAIGAKTLKIKPNLNQALKHLRDEDCPIAVWVDALCINQFDKDEKEEQVLKMAEIYRNAYNVNIWLGCDDPERPVADKAMTLIEEINQGDMLLTDDAYVQNWAALFELLRWSWFSRRWIVQELALAKSATIHCGKHACRWSDFQNAVSIFCLHFEKLKPKLIAHFEASSPKHFIWNDDSVSDGTIESTKGLEYLVCRLSGFDTSDPRDTIYALRNIAKELNRTEPEIARRVPVPDYGKDLFEVYRDFVKYAIEDSKSVDIFCRHWALKELPKETSTTPRLVQLPSWIQFVDDSAFGKGEDLFNGRKAGDSFVGLPESNIYHAAGTGASRRSPVVTFPQNSIPNPSLDITSQNTTHDMSVLVRGLVIGTISFRTDPFPDGIITKECLSSLGWSTTKAIADPPHRLWQTLTAARDPAGNPVRTWYPTACKHALQNISRNGHLNINSILRNLRRKPSEEFKDNILQHYLQRVLAVTWDRSFIEAVPTPTNRAQSPDKLVGFGPPKTQNGDVVAILYGCSVPVILRPVTGSGSLEGYQFVGEAYIYGKMDGEALEDEFEETDFRLI